MAPLLWNCISFLLAPSPKVSQDHYCPSPPHSVQTAYLLRVYCASSSRLMEDNEYQVLHSHLGVRWTSGLSSLPFNPGSSGDFQSTWLPVCQAHTFSQLPNKNTIEDPVTRSSKQVCVPCSPLNHTVISSQKAIQRTNTICSQ